MTMPYYLDNEFLQNNCEGRRDNVPPGRLKS